MKEIKLVLLYFVVPFFSLISCKKDPKDDSDIRYQLFQLEGRGWKSRMRTQKVDDIGFTATEVPIQYYLLKNQGSQDLWAIDSIYKANKTERVMEFVFQQEEEKELLDPSFTGISYEEGLKYLAFGIDQDFYVVTSKKDTIPCAGVNYERTYKITPYQKILLYFSGIQPDEEVQLIYKDKLFKKGTLKFKFNSADTQIKL
ncbi:MULTISPECIES: hypothetical protein [Flavobacterium]|uniref:Uncharacterized protein n=1 Tax=Flavobacterium covae TaxID=2906076 RepID=A0ABW8PE49_9FLAO|nr:MULTISPECIES: hypothetical protein [Flavobacterium]OXA82870.1 hypothetical protein B0A56_03955 [Flavobacterium columnare NBRC 100251 = ATCC 23463]AMA50300.1 hypothetical protein AWN65_12925 [Flavobacterium covae]AND64158.1 hypothetical protein AX766_06905 [Flavobacterium covae]MCJ1809358.1 hypothetical protein [Flavobacterium covae]OWP81838.1 hypothetical protein BWK63_04060 [Flavobacterium covae]